MKLVIGNKTYSSWSLRPWLLLRHAGIPFEEVRLSFLSPTFKRDALAHSPVGKVPVLVDRGVAIWDSLAIAEYVAETHPERALWPADRAERAHARSICAEMHASFMALRSSMPMNLSGQFPGRGWNLAVQKDIDRICQIWTELRAANHARGPFLFGAFTVADAYYAPVATRFETYRPSLPAVASDYAATLLALPAMKEWTASAATEKEFVPEDEPYRAAP